MKLSSFGLLIIAILQLNFGYANKDSIATIIQDYKEDTNYVNSLMALADLIHEDEIDSALQLVQSANTMSLNLKFEKGIEQSYEWIGYLYGYMGNYDTALQYHNLCLDYCKEKGNLKGEANALNNLGMIYYRQNNLDSTVYYFKESLEVEEKIDNKEGVAASLNNIGYILKHQGKIIEALDYYQRAIEIKEKMGNPRALANSYNNLAAIYYGQGDVPNSLKYHHKALILREKEGKKEEVAISLGNMGVIYKSQKDYEKALEYHRKALELYQSIQNDRGAATALSNIGSVLQSMKDSIGALEHYQLALTLHKKVDNKQGMAITSNNIGKLYENFNELDKANQYLDSSLKYSQLIQDLDWEIAALIGKAAVSLKSGNLAEAESLGKLSIAKSEELGFMENLTNSSKLMSNIYRKQGKYKEALLMQDKFIQYSDSLVNETNRKSAIRSQTKYELEKAQLVKEQKQKELKLMERAERNRKNNLQYSVIFIVLIALFAAVISLGVFKISLKFAEGMVFFAFLIAFEFILVLCDPYIETISSGEPGYKLVINAAIAAIIFPLHNLFENAFKRKLLKNERKAQKGND